VVRSVLLQVDPWFFNRSVSLSLLDARIDISPRIKPYHAPLRPWPRGHLWKNKHTKESNMTGELTQICTSNARLHMSTYQPSVFSGLDTRTRRLIVIRRLFTRCIACPFDLKSRNDDHEPEVTSRPTASVSPVSFWMPFTRVPVVRFHRRCCAPGILQSAADRACAELYARTHFPFCRVSFYAR